VKGERLVGLLSERDLMEPAVFATRPARGGEPAGTVRERMSAAPETVSVDEAASRASRRLHERRIGCLPVVADGRLVGVLSESDLLRLYVSVCAMAGRDAAVDPPVEACMSREVVTIAPGTSVTDAFDLCRSRGVRHLPVVRDGWLVGIASDRDLMPVIGRDQGRLRGVEDVMTKDYVAVTGRATPLSAAAACMLRDGFHSLPVLEDGALVGIVTSADVLRALARVDEDTLESAWTSRAALDAAREEE
jgi:CBS domain-containing protein